MILVLQPPVQNMRAVLNILSGSGFTAKALDLNG